MIDAPGSARAPRAGLGAPAQVVPSAGGRLPGGGAGQSTRGACAPQAEDRRSGFTRHDVWIDTDPSLGLPFHEADDAFALVQAFHSPELRIRGVSTSYGNASLAATTRIGRRLVERFGGPAGLDVRRVFPGAASATDLGRETSSTEALAEALRAGPGPLTFLALAPLTNLASVLRRHPELAARLAQVVFVGGRTPGRTFRVGWNPYEFHDANFHQDPPAAAEVLRATDVPLTLAPVELALGVPPLDAADLRRIGREGDAAGRFLARAAWPWRLGWRVFTGLPGGVAFDCFAVLAVTHPHLLATEERFVGIHADLHGGDAPARRREPCHLLASRELGPWTTATKRRATFCTSARPGAKETLLARLAGPGDAA